MVAVVVLVGCVHSGQDPPLSFLCTFLPGAVVAVVVVVCLYVRKFCSFFPRLVKGASFSSSGAAGFLVSVFVGRNIY